jgi:branched-chain amino acid transport system substrate-binding protein
MIFPFVGALQAQETLKIGFSGALTRAFAPYGLSNLYGMECAVNEINAAGGVLGKQVEIVPLDDECEPENAIAVAKEFIKQGITLIIGHSCSEATEAALEVYGDKALVISGSATKTSLTESGKNPYFFRTGLRDDAATGSQIQYLKDKGFKNVAIVHDDTDYGVGVSEIINAKLTSDPSGISVALFEGINSAEDSFDKIISQIAASKADVLVWTGVYNDATKLIIGLKDKGLNLPILSSDALFTQSFINQAGLNAEGIVLSVATDPSTSKEAQQAIKDHHSRHAEDIGPYFFNAAGATKALLAAVSSVGNTTDLAAIKKHLGEDTVETIQGPVRFDSKGDIIGVKIQLVIVKDGKFVPLTN